MIIKISSARREKDEADIDDLPSNDFAAGVIRGIKQFKAGQGKVYKNKDEFLDSLRDL